MDDWEARFGPSTVVPAKPAAPKPKREPRKLIEYWCSVCGKMAHWGFKVLNGEHGVWYCRDHKPNE